MALLSWNELTLARPHWENKAYSVGSPPFLSLMVLSLTNPGLFTKSMETEKCFFREILWAPITHSTLRTLVGASFWKCVTLKQRKICTWCCYTMESHIHIIHLKHEQSWLPPKDPGSCGLLRMLIILGRPYFPHRASFSKVPQGIDSCPTLE